MRHEISYRPTFAQLKVALDRGEAIRAESGAMLGHTAGIDVETGTGGGLLGSLKRTVLGGESFFVNTFAAREPGSVTFAPRLPGDVVERELGQESVFVQSSSFLAGTPGVELDTKFGGFRSFFAGEGLFLLRLTGPGTAFLSSFGAIDRIPLAAGDRYTVDTGHVVAFDASVDYSVRQVGGLKSTLLSGEGLVVEFEGPGAVWTQSRSPDAFLDWIASNVSSGGAVVPVGDVGSDSPAAESGGPAAGRGGRESGRPAGTGRGGANAVKSAGGPTKRRGSTFAVTRPGARGGRSGGSGRGGGGSRGDGGGRKGASPDGGGSPRRSNRSGGGNRDGGGGSKPSRRSGGKRP